MSILFAESGSDATQGLEFYATSTGTVASSTTYAKTGPRSIKFDSTAGDILAAIYAAITQKAAGRADLWVYFDDLPSTATLTFISAKLITTTIVQVDVTTGGVIQLRASSGSQLGSDGSTIQADKWYRFCLTWNITNTTTFTIKLYLNGSLDITANSGTLGNSSVNRIYFGWYSNSAGASKQNYFDDIYADDISDNSDTGDIRITNKRPYSNGTTNGWGTTGTPSGYGSGQARYVNQQPLDITAYVSTTDTATTVEEYNIEGKSTGDYDLTNGATIIDSMGWWYSSSSGSFSFGLIMQGSSAPTSHTTTKTIKKYLQGDTSYPAGNTDVGADSGTAVGTKYVYECGILFIFNPPKTYPWISSYEIPPHFFEKWEVIGY